MSCASKVTFDRDFAITYDEYVRIRKHTSTMAEEKMISLLYFARRPTKTCFRLVLLCVYVFVYNPHIVCPSLLDDNFTSYMDNATAYFAMCLCCLLALGGFGLIWCMSYNSLRETVIKSSGQVRLFLFNVCSVLFAVGFYAFLTSGLFFATRTVQSFTARQFRSSLVWMCDSGGQLTHSSGDHRMFLGWNNYHQYEEKLERYLSEDVQFVCEFDIPDMQALDVDSNITYTLWWTRDVDRNPVRSSSRFIFDEQTGADIKYTVTRDDSLNKIRATLLILRLNESDFGMYQCHAQVRKSRKQEQTRSAQIEYADEVTQIDVGTFNLERLNLGHLDFEVYPGQMLVIDVQPWMITYNDDEIFFIHRVNSSKLEANARVENRSDLCTYTYSGKMHVIDRNRQRDKRYIKTSLIFDPDLYDCIVCVQFEDYTGVHFFVVRRHFYNQDIHGPDFIETEVPLSVSVRPSKHLWGTLGFNESFFTECWEGIFFTPSEHCLDWGYSMMETALKWYCCVGWFIGYVIPLVIIFPYMKLTKCLLSFLLQGSICPPVINSLCGVTCTPAIMQTGRIPFSCYDVFLAHSNDVETTADAVCEVLKGQSLRVFDCQRDVSPNEPLLVAWDRAIDDSASFVVLVSRQYLADPVLQAQFRFMHYRVLSHQVPEDKMLIIPLGHVPISRDLGPLPVIDPRQVKSYRQLEWWALAVAARHGRKNIAIMLAQNAGRDARHLLIKRRRFLQQPLEVSDAACMEGERAVCLPLGGRSYSDHDDKVAKKDVFLTYCEDSDSDCALAEKVLSHLQGLGLSVLDVVHDILGGREETAVVAAAAQCASFVVLLSPAYRSHPLNRRLHFPQVLQAVETGRVSVDHVLIIRTGYGKNSAIVTNRTTFNPHVYAATGTVSITSGLMDNGVNDRSPCGSTHGEIYRVTDQVAAAARTTHPEITRDRCVEGPPGSDVNKTPDTNKASSKIATTPKARSWAEDEGTDHTGCLHRSATQAYSGSSEVTSVDTDITVTRSLAIQPWSRTCQDDYRCIPYFQPEAWPPQVDDNLQRFCDEENLGEDNYSLPGGLQGLTVFSWTGGLAEEDYLRYVSRWAKPVLTYVNDHARAAAGKNRLNVNSRFPSIRE